MTKKEEQYETRKWQILDIVSLPVLNFLKMPARNFRF